MQVPAAAKRSSLINDGLRWLLHFAVVIAYIMKERLSWDKLWKKSEKGYIKTIDTGSRGVQFEQVNKKTSYLLKCNHAFRFPLKTPSAMHLCKFVTVHCFKIDTIVLYSIVSLRAPLF